ncbi:hypothetical protein B0T21DRAFT_358422 [Apiosordaria backusii]|uniref:Uncharacterized protein n=1 Tax=Apiosordaria backusii TaxID=314023 RepID=A0AA40ESP4_9PEZI|nr:hypothetical protein B0T21DRAFT_358422 [Apiosordaria backusii]
MFSRSYRLIVLFHPPSYSFWSNRSAVLRLVPLGFLLCLPNFLMCLARRVVTEVS